MGKLIVIEGTDGSGKSTQFRLLTQRVAAEGYEFQKLVFPQYKEESSALIRMYLGGEFGSKPSDVSAYAATTFFVPSTLIFSIDDLTASALPVESVLIIKLTVTNCPS